MPYVALADSGLGFTFNTAFPAAAQLTGSTVEVAGTEDADWDIAFDETVPFNGVQYAIKLTVTSLTPTSPPVDIGDPYFQTANVTFIGPADTAYSGFGGAEQAEVEPIEVYAGNTGGVDSIEFELNSASPHYGDPFTAMILVEVFVLGDGDLPCFWNEITNATQRCLE